MEFISDVLKSCLNDPLGCLLLTILVIVLFYWNGTRRYAIKSKIGLPGPKPLPYIGNVLDIIKAGGIVKFHVECARKYGKMFVYWAPHLAIFVGDPEMRNEITVKHFDNFRDRYLHFFKAGKSVFAAKGENWKRIRNILSPTFSAAKMKLMVPLMDRATNTLISKLQSVADSGTVVNMREWFDYLTLDVILMTAFGIESNVQTNPNSKLHQIVEVSFRVNSHHPSKLFLNSFPFGVGRKLGQWLTCAYLYCSPNKDAIFNYRLAQKVIKTRQEQLKKGESGRKDLLYLMLTAHESDGVKRLSDDEMAHQVNTFLIAGFETTSTALTCSLFHLAMNPAIQEKLREEIASVMSKNTESDFYVLVHTIEYLDCVLKEALRLVPRSQSIINRECSRSCTVNGVFFPAGAEVVLDSNVQHLDPDVFPDATKFDPERHRGLAQEHRHPIQFVPFGSGPRICIGQRFALLEVKLIIIKLLRKFKFVSAPDSSKERVRGSKMNVLVEAI